MYLSAQLEHENSSNVPLLQNARAVMTINSSRENHFPNAKVRVIRLESFNSLAVDNIYVKHGAAGADLWWQEYGWWVDERQYATHLCCLNEPSVKTVEEAQRVAAYMLRWMAILDSRYGGRIHGLMGDFSQGTPEPEAARYFVQCNNYMYEHGHAWAFHSYWYPRLNPDQERWNYTRWYYWEEALRRLGCKTPEYMITECGADGGLVGKIDQGWTTTGIDPLQYADDCRSFRKLVDNIGPFVTYGFLFAACNWDRFKTFELTGDILALVLNSNPQEVSVSLPIDGRCMTPEQFDSYIQGVTFATPRTKVFLHHTAIPTLGQWNGRTTILNMQKTYESWGWTKGPHVFAGPDGIWLFYDITKDGRHAGGIYNTGSVGWETVGNYDTSKPVDPVLHNTLSGIASIFRKCNLNPDTDLMFHRDVSVTHCPGLAVSKAWFVAMLKAEIVSQQPQENYEWAYPWRMLSLPDHSLYKYIKAKGYQFASPEFWNDSDADGDTAYQWGWDKVTNEYVLIAAVPPTWECRELMRMK